MDFPLIELSVAGLQHYIARVDLEKLERGMKLELVREPQNPYDGHAVRVDFAGRKIGYVPAISARMVAGLIDNGYTVRATIEAVSPPKLVVVMELRMPAMMTA